MDVSMLLFIRRKTCYMTTVVTPHALSDDPVPHCPHVLPPCFTVCCALVVSSIQLGELLCDSLVNAENAESLSFVLLEDERVVAQQTSYVVTDGDAFSDGIGRKVRLQRQQCTVVHICLGNVRCRKMR